MVWGRRIRESQDKGMGSVCFPRKGDGNAAGGGDGGTESWGVGDSGNDALEILECCGKTVSV